MHNCMFTGHCIEPMCDGSCPALAETTYLMERNNISINSPVFRADKKAVAKIQSIIDKPELIKVIQTVDTIKTAELVTYCGICNHWKGNRLHCNVYNLRYGKFIDDTKKSWSMKTEPDSLEYTRIWSNSAKILIISNMDYVSFGDFECQTLLGLIQSREQAGLQTILVTPKLKLLVGKGIFFDRLSAMLGKAVVE